MGALISAPLSAATTCLGSACGACLAAGCGRLAASGSVSSAKAAQCVLLWLQVFTAAVAWIASSTAGKWLPWSCGKLGAIGLDDLGVCECQGGGDELTCWSDQLVYRAEAAGVVVFCALCLMAVSGCAEGAAKSYAVAKFMVVLLLGVVSLFLPNSIFNAFGTLATSASAIYLVVQAVLLIDFGYSWNELWYSNALEAQRRNINRRGYKAWTGGLMAASAVLFIASVALSICLFLASSDAAARGVNLAAMITALLLLVVSILDWCEHGALLTSAVVMAYAVLLVSEALAVLPEGRSVRSPTWVGMAVCCVSLLSLARGSGSSASSAAPRPSEQQHPAGAALVEVESGGGAGGEGRSGADGTSGADATAAAPEGEQGGVGRSFATHCGVHGAAALYVAASLAPRAGTFTFAAHVAAVFASLLLYGWSLVAPKILTGRNFQ